MKTLTPPLDPGFNPLSIVFRDYQKAVQEHGASQHFVVRIQRAEDKG